MDKPGSLEKKNNQMSFEQDDQVVFGPIRSNKTRQNFIFLRVLVRSLFGVNNFF